MHIEPTVSLKDGLALYAKVTRELARRLSPGPKRDDLINAQVRIRGKARLPLSVRLTGRIRLRGDGDVEFGRA